jgi:(E)-4-hydroxy-3-methylbut-2-enyl-diphosphate synthase
MRCVQSLDPVMVLLNIADGVSRLHASRRVFEIIKKLDIDAPVILHKRCVGSARLF